VRSLLPPGLRVLCYDKRGHGLSSDAGATMRIADYAADLAALMDHLEIGPAHIVGLSIGGMIALSLSETRPDLIKSLVLADTGHRIGTPAVWQSRIEAVTAGGLEAVVDGTMERWFSPTYRKDVADDVMGWRTMVVRTPVAGYLAACGAIRDADFEPAARAIRIPTLCVVGSTDTSTPPELVKSLSDLIPGSKYHLIEGPAHLPNLETPKIFRDLLLDHLDATAVPAERFAAGMKTRRAVLGEAHVDRAEANKTAFDIDFQTFITEGAWGSVWSRPGLTRRERSMITLALLAALGHHEEVAMHTRAAQNTGTSLDDIKEALLHVAVYGGVPAANTAIRIVKDTVAKEGAAAWDRKV
jgi:3-oxoadipate enol-lactonase/4-carboxymuconolactone decarboxylase